VKNNRECCSFRRQNPNKGSSFITTFARANHRQTQCPCRWAAFLCHHYVEFHVTPNNYRLQLRIPDTATLRRAQAANAFDELLLPDGVFRSRTWTQAEKRKWFVYAVIPAAAVYGADQPLDGRRWRFSFSRYDYIGGRPEPIISSTSPHAMADFHRRQEWGTLLFV
jgi:hypothetical protein